MDITDIIKESITFPFNDYKGWLIIGLLSLINAIISIGLSSNSIFAVILSIISLIIEIMLYGIALDVIRGAINKSTEIPQIDFSKNIVDGIKTLILLIIYMIIPTIITLIVAFASGFLNTLYELVMEYGSATAPTVPEALVSDFAIGMIITCIVAFIVFVIFGLFTLIGEGILAETGSIKAALNINDVINKISNIGWLKYIGFAILIGLVTSIIAIIGGILARIPTIGSLIAALIINSYVLLVTNHAYGLIYRESKE
ncbi:DUF4013 domain-containing protein [Methanosphaera sp. WGK6]|uniref:DUF4013 domain-containing protein n=1 Tax=Methanosphaera sp. WGK6 TaxID=1561964 RepID=UPI00084C3F31|nr:DUF4013 domain-containing protein [Methanosphaera sp. WGK6]OED29505.1 hypothetical protein NL43_07915 [Methanosphaera sp. WGK6]